MAEINPFAFGAGGGSSCSISSGAGGAKGDTAGLPLLLPFAANVFDAALPFALLVLDDVGEPFVIFGVMVGLIGEAGVAFFD